VRPNHEIKVIGEDEAKERCTPNFDEEERGGDSSQFNTGEPKLGKQLDFSQSNCEERNSELPDLNPI